MRSPPYSKAVLLSSLFVYNQMGGIDEAALDRLSLVTEMTKHIRVRATPAGDAPPAAKELGRFSPSFIWLLRDFYLDLCEDGRDIKAAEYLETALRAVPGNGTSVRRCKLTRALESTVPPRFFHLSLIVWKRM